MSVRAFALRAADGVADNRPLFSLWDDDMFHGPWRDAEEADVVGG